MGLTEEDVTSIANKLPDEIEKMKHTQWMK